MPSWWGNPFSKETRKQGNKDGVFHVQSLIPSPRRRNKKLEVEVESPKLPKAAAGIASASKHISVLKGVGRCASFGSRPVQAQPLPLPGAPPSKRLGQKSNNASLNRYPSFPLPSPEQVRLRVDSVDIDGPEAEYGSGSSASSLASVDVADVWHPNMPPHIANLRIPATRESGGQMWSNITSTRGGKHKWELSRQGLSCPSSPLLRSNRGNPFSKGNTVQEDVSSQPHVRADVAAAVSNSTLVSPARSPRKEQGQHNVLQPNHDTTSGQGSSPGSGHNSAGGELPPWYQARTSPELSPVPSPMRSPGPGSRVQSGSVSPLHPRVGGGDSETYRRHGEDNRGMGHRLPLPPATYSPASATLPSSPSASSVPPRSPSRMDNASTSGTRWQKGKLIGRGTFGNVYVGFDSENVGRMCAMKEVLLVSDDSKSKESAKQLGQEIALLSRLRHPNIVQYYGSETMEDRLYIYLEYVSGGSIHKLLHEYGPFKEPVICSYTRQILSGLAYLHSANTVHRDIKGANILVDTNGIVKLADFGMAKHITAQSFPLSFKGSPYWMAPEVIKPTHGYDLSVDIWSLGCTVLEMATAKPPWSQYEGVAAMFKIGNSKELPAIPDFLSKECKSFVKLCLQRNPSDRATAATLLMHPFVNSARPVSVPEDKVDAFDLMVSPSVGAGTYGGGYQNAIHDVENNSPRLQSRAWMQCSPPSDISPRAQAGFTSSSASPCASPKFRPLSPHHAHLGISSSQSSSPVISSGSSTPVTGGHGNLPFPGNGFYGAPSTFSHDGYYQFQKLSNGTHATGSPVGKVGLWSIPQSPGSPKQNEYVNSNTDILGLALGRVPREEDDYYERHHSGNGIVTDHIPQRLLKRSHRTFPMLYWQGSPMLSSNSANRGANQ